MSDLKLSSDWQVAISATDTVYGLLCRIDSSEEQTKKNIDRIYEIKNRDRSKPLILFAASVEAFKPFVEGWNDELDQLCEKHWPGAFTLVVKRSPQLAPYINPGLDTIGLRIPDSPSIFKLLADTANGLLLSTSANLSGEAEVQNHTEALQQFEAEVDLVLEPGSDEKPRQKASTIYSFINGELKTLRA